MVKFSENIKRIRLSKGLKLADVYTQSGLSRIAYMNIEKGNSNPNSTNLIKIANALGVSLNELIQEPKTLKSLRYRFQKISTTKDKTKRLEEEIKLAKWLKNYNYLESILDDKLTYKLRPIVTKQPIEAAKEAREILSIEDNEPIFDIVTLLEVAGVKVYLYKSVLKQNFGMSLDESDGGPVVAVNINDSLPIERQIFTAAHELGHLILHKNSYREELLDENTEEEREADLFASHFLMPDSLFIKKINEAKGKNWIDIVLHVKRFFKVSYKTVLRRLIDLGMVDSSKYNIYLEFAKDYKKLYNHDLKNHFEPDALGEEPEGMSKSDIMAERYNRMIHEALNKDLITISKAAEMLGKTLPEMKDYTKSWRFLG